MGLLTGEVEQIVVPDNVHEIWVPIYIHGIEMSLLLDTGTSHSILTLEAYMRIPESRRPRLDPPNVILKQATGSRVKVWGRTTVELRVGNQSEQVTVVVGQVTGNMLGMDFLRRTGANLDFARLQLRWGGCVVQCSSVRNATNPTCSRVVTASDVKVPAGYTRVVSASLSGIQGSEPVG